MDDEFETVTIPNLTKFVTDCFLALSVPKIQSEIMAASIVEADVMGRNCEGLFTLETCIMDIYSGLIDTKASPKIDKESPATAWVNGNNALGPVVAKFCMKLAIQKAKLVGTAIIVAKHSNQFGTAARYAKLALEEGLIGWACSNTHPYMVPNRAKYACIGTNVLSVGAPGLFGDYFLLDMSTSAISPNSVTVKGYKEEFLPVGLALNAAGLAETNSDVAAKTKNFLPLGSEESSSSYKGTGLSMMIDILCGVLGGSYYSSEVGIVRTEFLNKRANISHCFIVINPKYFAPGFEMRANSFLTYLRNLEPLDPMRPVKVSGDGSRDVFKLVEKNGGLRYPKYLIDSVNKIAKMLKVKPLQVIPKPTAVMLTPSQELAVRLEMEERAKRVMEEESISVDVAVEDLESVAGSMHSVFDIEEDPSEWMLR
ncbi:delta(1)-pyrroline-2-carboxylate/Delta(1)-piperideine-2-carboxylate reductase-like [Harmonia axyridis]|uniref:delta(1)-pyrroline-2-carboxylate/Delta(1)- piperideine-2-carboxylate reductase-like n=1 Tax=Harmonia axyridis TaxID=115357 RepID=UPI001E2779C3|nr:delta(1)-pyrroline-2-carboxylate/Delta(1)-piperideine-2-carboxylate reductase-like [Harmonia axyridis]